MKKITMTVSIVVTEDVTRAEAEEYVFDAVSSWGRQFHPEDPFFNLDGRVTGKPARRMKPKT